MSVATTKVTVELPDDLVRELKIRAAAEKRRLKDVAAEMMRKGLKAGAETPRRPSHRVELPLVRGTRSAPPEEEGTPERVADILLAQEVDRLVRDDGTDG